MAEETLGRATAIACTEIGIAFDGLDGVLELIANNPGKEIRIKRDSLFFAIEPHVKRMKTALDDLNAVRKEVRDATAQAALPSS